MPEESLTTRTVHGLKWSYLSTMVNVVLQIGVTAVLARLLTPSAFGLVAMAALFLRFGQYFAQMGAGQAVVQRPDLSATDTRTAFTSSLLIGAAFCAMFLVLAPLAALLFPDTNGVVAVTRVMSLTFVIGGLSATTQGLLHRRFAFRAIALTEIGSFVIGYALIGMVLAFSGFGAWSLVFAILGQGALAAVAYTVLCRDVVGLGLDVNSLKSIYSFGWRVSLIGFGDFVAANLDTLWAGHYLGSRATGIYTRATNIANVPVYHLAISLSRVLLPGYSRIQFERERLRSTYLATVAVIGALTVPIAWGVAASSQEVVLVLLGDQWLAAAPVLAILSLAAPFSVLTHFGTIVCEATARLNVRIGITVLRIGWFAALLAALARFGIVGIAMACALSEIATHAAYMLVMRRMLALTATDLQRVYSVALGSGAITALTLMGLHFILAGRGWPVWAILASEITMGVICLVATLARARRGAVWHEIRRRLVEAGYPENRGWAWVLRRMDSLAESGRAKSRK